MQQQVCARSWLLTRIERPFGRSIIELTCTYVIIRFEHIYSQVITVHEVLIDVLFAMRLTAIALAIALQPPIYIVIPSIALAYAFDIRGYSERPSMLTAKIALGVYAVIFASMAAMAFIK